MARKKLPETAPEYDNTIAKDQARQAEVFGITRKLVRIMREKGVIDYPMPRGQYEFLVTFFRGVGVTEILRGMLYMIDRPRRDKLMATADMGKMEAYSYGFFIRFRLTNLHILRARCTYKKWNDEMRSKFPAGIKHLTRDLFDQTRIKARNAVFYAVKSGGDVLQHLMDQYGLEQRDYDGVIVNTRKLKDRRSKRRRAHELERRRTGTVEDRPGPTDPWAIV